MKSIALAADTSLEIPGALNVAVIDESTGEILLKVDVSDASYADDVIDVAPVRTKGSGDIFGRKLADSPNCLCEVEDIMVTSDTHYHIIRPITAVRGVYNLFFVLTLERSAASLVLARQKMAQIENSLTFSPEEMDMLQALGLKNTGFHDRMFA